MAIACVGQFVANHVGGDLTHHTRQCLLIDLRMRTRTGAYSTDTSSTVHLQDPIPGSMAETYVPISGFCNNGLRSPGSIASAESAHITTPDSGPTEVEIPDSGLPNLRNNLVLSCGAGPRSSQMFISSHLYSVVYQYRSISILSVKR